MKNPLAVLKVDKNRRGSFRRRALKDPAAIPDEHASVEQTGPVGIELDDAFELLCAGNPKAGTTIPDEALPPKARRLVPSDAAFELPTGAGKRRSTVRRSTVWCSRIRHPSVSHSGIQATIARKRTRIHTTVGEHQTRVHAAIAQHQSRIETGVSQTAVSETSVSQTAVVKTSVNEHRTRIDQA